MPDKPSIAVLPFENLSEDKSQDFIADGMTEDIISALARFKQLFVIARNSTQTYKGKAVKVQQVAEELGVRYVLEGSMEISKDRIRVTAQLIDAIAGTHLWVERYDRPLTDVFQVRDEVTRKLVGSLAGKLDQAEMARASLQHPDSLDAYGLYWRALSYFCVTPLLITPRPGRCLKKRLPWIRIMRLLRECWRGHIFMIGCTGGSRAKPKESYQKALESPTRRWPWIRATAWTRCSLGYFLLYGRKFDEAAAEFEEALKANPNDAHLIVHSAEFYSDVGQPEEAIRRIKEAMRLNPNYPNWYLWHFGLGPIQCARL